jgi:hypothetical protein
MTDLTEESEALIVEVEGTDAAEESDVFMTEAGHPIEQEQATDIVRKLSDNTAIHALLKSNPCNDSVECFATDQSGPNEFHGIMIDTGAAGKPTAGYNQYTAYERLFGITPIDTNQEGAVKAMFGIGSTASIGSITISTPIGQCEFHGIIETNKVDIQAAAWVERKEEAKKEERDPG